MENFEQGRISKAAGGAQVTRCSANKYNPPHESNRVDTVSEVRTTLQLWLHITTVLLAFFLFKLGSCYLLSYILKAKKFADSAFQSRKICGKVRKSQH